MKKELTGYPSIDLPQSREATFMERNPIIPSIDITTIFKLLSLKNRNLPAVDSDALKASYQELIDDAHNLSLAFRELGVKKKDIVTISLPSNYQALLCFFALNEIGAITTYIDNYASEVEVLSYLSKYQSPILINFDKSKEYKKKIKSKSNVRYIITLNEKLANSKDIYYDYNLNKSDYALDFHTLGSLANFQKDKFHLPNKGSDDALILYTSGSTGEPKAVVLTNKNILAAEMYAGNTSHTENITGTKTMVCVPLRYPYGFVTSLLTSLLWGKLAILTPRWDIDTVIYYFKKEPNIIFGSPAVLSMVTKCIPEGMDLSQISHFISGGDFLTISHANQAYAFFKEHNNSTIEIGNGCGNAETVSIGSTPVGVPLKQATAGKILVGTTPLVIDKDIPDDLPILNGDELEEKKYNEIGELCLAGEFVFKKYFGEPEKTECAKFKRNGKTFFRTGTLGFIDEEGYFTPTNRKSRFFIRSTGHKVYLDNVQRIIGASYKGIADIACVKVPDSNELYITKAYVVLKKGVLPNEDTIRSIYDSLLNPIVIDGKLVQLKEYEIPKSIEFVTELPRVYGSEKIYYKVLEEEALQELNKAKTLTRKKI